MQEQAENSNSHVVWQRGFRPFFLGASIFAIYSMASWLAVYRFGLQIDISIISIFQWHAHELIYGYAMAVIAGFLLTAAQNWTGVETLSGGKLAGLFLLWLLARVLMVPGTAWIAYASFADLTFMLGLAFAIAHPVLKVRQKRQAPVLLILGLLAVGNAGFYAGVLFKSPQWVSWSIYGGLYLVLGLVLFMGRRVIPFFAQRGVGYPVELHNSRWNDIASWILFPSFVVSELINSNGAAGAVIAAALFLSNTIRLAGWYTPGIWRKPLLWSLYLSFLLITLGFLLRGLALYADIPPLIPIHAFAVGGIGLVTISMMSRVSIGHTGRNVHDAPRTVPVFLSVIVLSGTIRIVFTLFDPSRYTLWITLSGLLWIIAFGLFAASIGPILLRKRADAR
jgi:uncharacterized protein involved in response to NO